VKVSAIVVTRGDVPLEPILATFREVDRIDDVVVWDNSKAPGDLMTWGRHYAARYGARHPVIYSQDDDLVHTPDNINRILDAYRPDTLTGCMWPEWSAGARRQGIANGYDDLVFPGSGSVYDYHTAHKAARAYLEHYPYDDFFRLWCDAIIGVLAPTVRLDIRFDTLPAAHGPGRMATLPKAKELKREAIERARRIRDEEA
jgi:hypothetical protein